MDVDSETLRLTFWVLANGTLVKEEFLYMSVASSTDIGTLKMLLRAQSTQASVSDAGELQMFLKEKLISADDSLVLSDFSAASEDVVMVRVIPGSGAAPSSGAYSESAPMTTGPAPTSTSSATSAPPATSATSATGGAPASSSSTSTSGTSTLSADLSTAYFDPSQEIPPPPSWMTADPSALQSVIRADESQLHQILHTNPTLGEAIMSEGTELLAAYQRQSLQQYNERVKMEQRRRIALMADPLNPETQRIIAKEIEEKQVRDNYEMATEHMPEAFGRVVMLYVPMEIEGVAVTAFIDSGAQATIISEDMAKRCNIYRFLDRRFAGVAKGVGTAKIVGRIHMAKLKFGKSTFLPCSFTVMEDPDMEFLFGLDMLRRHQGVIDLQMNVLRIGEESVGFLSETEVPKLRRAALMEAGLPTSPVDDTTMGSSSSSSTGGGSGSSSAMVSGPSAATSSVSATGVSGGSSTASTGGASTVDSGMEGKIQTLMTNMHCTREQAQRALLMTGGNEEMAASVLFEMTGGGFGF